MMMLSLAWVTLECPERLFVPSGIIVLTQLFLVQILILEYFFKKIELQLIMLISYPQIALIN